MRTTSETDDLLARLKGALDPSGREGFRVGRMLRVQPFRTGAEQGMRA